ncbi:MAG: LamG-like jellyroll fold domain-containing protein, partial [Thermodesulfobacteriota bacterium]
WQSWQSLTRTVSLSAGPQTMRIVMDENSIPTSSVANINWVRLVQSAAIPQPIAHWRLDEVTGTIASDASGNGHDGTLINGPLWSTGRITGALSFDGTNDHIIVQHNDALNTASLTIAGWVKLSGQGSNYQVLWLKLQVNDSNGYFMIVNSLNSATPSRLEWTVSKAGTYYQVFSTTVLTNNVWYHVAVTFSGTTSRIYVNGSLEGTNFAASKGTTTDPFYLGIEDGDCCGPLNGILDDVRIYDRELTAAEIQLLYLEN